MKRTLILIYGATSYLIFFATFLYAIGFVGNLGVPRAIDGEPRVALWQALLVNLGLLAAFAVQHSVMARPAFKRWWMRIVPQPAERSTYVLASSVALIALFAHWEPLGGVVWNLQDPWARTVAYASFAFGWGLVLVATFCINHFDLFGLRQVWLHFHGREYAPLPFKLPLLYRYVRHPLYLGWFFAFWATPTMTATHLLFAVMTTAYILVATVLEERDLIEMHPEYADYRERVPKYFPRLARHEPDKGGAPITA